MFNLAGEPAALHRGGFLIRYRAGIFLSTSATTNAGMALIDTGLSAFQQEPGVLIITSFVCTLSKSLSSSHKILASTSRKHCIREYL